MAGRVQLCDYDPAWPERYRRHAARIGDVLGERALRIEHVGSTSVPGLPAKPIIDIVLEVADSAVEGAYGPALEAAGYVVRIREPEWFEHRMVCDPSRTVQVHVFSAGCPETERMLAFRDRLRRDGADRDLYAGVKRELASSDWAYMQQYADAKSEVIASILARAGA
jgi:GrpB-like predicted nucleotidyltransferase (UPF0157 family)